MQARRHLRLIFFLFSITLSTLGLGQDKKETRDPFSHSSQRSRVNPYLALYESFPLEHIFEESERHILQELRAIRDSDDAGRMKGIQFTPNAISVDVSVWPQYYELYGAYSSFCSRFTVAPLKERMISKLMDLGFRTKDLPQLEQLSLMDGDEGVYQKNTRLMVDEAISKQPFGDLHHPSLERVEASTVEEFRHYLEMQHQVRRSLEIDRAVQFLKSLSPHSCRVFLSYLFQSGSGVVTYSDGFTKRSAEKHRNALIRQFSMGPEEVDPTFR